MLRFLGFDGVYFGCCFLSQNGVAEVRDKLEDLRCDGVGIVRR